MEEHMSNMENRERRHLTWPELEERYATAETFEERLGLIHATKTAVIVEGTRVYNGTFTYGPTRIAGVNFLTTIGDETRVLVSRSDVKRECNNILRRHARIMLARSFVDGWTPCDGSSSSSRKRSAPADAIVGGGWGTSAQGQVGLRAILRLVDFYGLTDEHLDGLDDEGRRHVRSFIKERWEWQFSNEREFVPRGKLIAATMHLKAYELLVKYVVLDAIPVLYRNVVALVNEWRRSDGEKPYANVLGMHGAQHLFTADLRQALIVCAEVLDASCDRRVKAKEYNDASIAQTHTLLALLALHEREHSQPIKAEPAVAP